jgi:hypothetical protein
MTTLSEMNEKVGAVYWDSGEFLEDMRAGKLNDRFKLDENVFRELCVMVNTDEKLAGEVADAGVILLLASDDKFETEGLVALAEVCRGRGDSSDRVSSVSP